MPSYRVLGDVSSINAFEIDHRETKYDDFSKREKHSKFVKRYIHLVQDDTIIIIVFYFERNSQKWWNVEIFLIKDTYIWKCCPVGIHVVWYFDIENKNHIEKDTIYTGYSCQTFPSYASTDKTRRLQTRHCNIFRIIHSSFKLGKK